MNTGNLPQGTADEPLSLDEGAEDITDILDDPQEDNVENESEEKADDQVTESETEVEEDEEAGEDEIDDEEVDDDEEEDTSEYAGGRFAADNAKVTLDDGTTISVGELKRNNLFQRDYTKKTTELAEKAKAFEATQVEVNQFAETLNQQRDFLLNAQQHFLPPAPDPSTMETDPFGYMQQKEHYEQTVNALNQLHAQQQQFAQQQETQQAQEAEQDLARRQAEILEHHADLRDPEQAKQFDQEFLNDFLPHYGFTSDEVRNVVDHKMLRVIRDAMAFRKLKASKPKAKAKLEGKPRLLKSGNRINPQQKISRSKKQRADRLSKTGSMQDGVAALMDLDL